MTIFGREVSLFAELCAVVVFDESAPRCELSVGAQPDAGKDVEARIEQLVARQRTIDSINHDPNTVGHEYNGIDRPPLRFRTNTGRGYLVHLDCGDCAHVELLFGKLGYVAYMELRADDDVPDLSRRLTEMIEVGKTFTWRGQGTPGH